MVLDIQTVHHILKNTAVQNVNKPFVYITDLTSTLIKCQTIVSFLFFQHARHLKIGRTNFGGILHHSARARKQKL
jgi:hypothetical protein